MATINLTNFSGHLNQHTSPGLLGEGQSPLMNNVSLAYDGALASRPGVTRLAALAGEGVWHGIGVMKRSNGTDRPFFAANGKIYYGDGATYLNEPTGTPQCSDGYDVEFDQFLDSMYYVSSKDGEYLMKISDADTPVQSVVSGNYDFKYLASGNGRLVASGWSLFPRRAFYSKLGTDQFNILSTTVSSVSSLTLTIGSSIFLSDMNGWEVYNQTRGITAKIESITSSTEAALTGVTSLSTWANGDTLILMTDFLDADTDVNGVISLGEQAPFVVLTRTDAYSMDPITRYSRKMDGFGCSSNKNPSVCKGYAIWAGTGGVYRFASGMDYPEIINQPLENELYLDGIWNNVTVSGLNSSASFSDGNSYYLSVGDLRNTIKGESYSDTMLVLSLSQRGWTVRTYQASAIGSCFAIYNDETLGKMVLAGSNRGRGLFRMDAPDTWTDDDINGNAQDYTSFWRSKIIEHGQQEREKTIGEGFIKCQTDSGITIGLAYTGLETYTPWATTSTTTGGNDYHFERLSPPAENACHSFSIEVRGTGRWRVDHINISSKENSSSNLNPI